MVGVFGMASISKSTLVKAFKTHIDKKVSNKLIFSSNENNNMMKITFENTTYLHGRISWNL